MEYGLMREQKVRAKKFCKEKKSNFDGGYRQKKH